MNRSVPISYFIMTHHKFFWWPSQCFWGLQAVSVHNSSAALSPFHPQLFCCAGRGRAFPSLSPPACFFCPSANSTPLTYFIWLFQCLPSLSLGAHGEHLQLSSASHMYFSNPVLPYCLQMQTYPQDRILSLFSLHICWAVLIDRPAWNHSKFWQQRWLTG